MKKITLFVSFAALLLLQACYDDYKVDFAYSTTYFPRQFPLRTLVDDGSSELAFEVGAVLGGKYENTVDELVDFQIQDTLLNNYPDLVKLPDSYYELSGTQIVIPSGDFKGAVKITMEKEEFMADPLAVGKNYALPLEITSATSDSILQTKRTAIIVVRYYNQYHGWYWLKGVDHELDAAGNIVASERYSQKDLVRNEDMLLTTAASNTVTVPYIGRFFNDQNEFTMLMEVNNNSCTLEGQNTAHLSEVSGTGSFDDTDKTFTLNYTYQDTLGVTHNVLDTLLFRNTELILEDWN